MKKYQAKYAKKHSSIRRYPIIAVLLVISLMMTAAFAGVTFSRYMTENFLTPRQADSADFYFTSDILVAADSGSIPTYNLVFDQGQTPQITFVLRNYKNDLNWSSANISYKVEYSLNKSSNISAGTGSIVAGASGVDKTVTLAPQGAKAGDTVTVMVTSTAPYEEVLTANFTFHTPDTGWSYDVSQNADSNVVMLTVTTKSMPANKTITVTYPSGVMPDPLDSRLTINGNKVSLTVSGEDQYTIVFYKTNPATSFTKSHFTLQAS